jgi:hypothetical protein
MLEHHVEQAVVRGHQLILSDLPFADGNRVDVTLTESSGEARRSIDEIRALLRGGVEKFDDPFEPMIPTDAWEMFKW